MPAVVLPTPAQHLFGLGDGDLVVATAGKLTRLALGDDDPRWSAAVRPIFERVCARCHQPGGSAGVDLSTAARWRGARRELVHRVVEARTMPPPGIQLDEAERRALAAWLAH